MSKIRSLIVGLTLVSLLAVCGTAVAGNGFRASNSNTFESPETAQGDCNLNEQHADGDGIPKPEGADWSRLLDGSGCGQHRGHAVRGPMDGSGFGAQQGGGLGQWSGSSP